MAQVVPNTDLSKMGYSWATEIKHFPVHSPPFPLCYPGPSVAAGFFSAKRKREIKPGIMGHRESVPEESSSGPFCPHPSLDEAPGGHCHYTALRQEVVTVSNGVAKSAVKH